MRMRRCEFKRSFIRCQRRRYRQYFNCKSETENYKVRSRLAKRFHKDSARSKYVERATEVTSRMIYS